MHAQKSVIWPNGKATRTALRTAARSKTSWATAPSMGESKPNDAATIPIILSAIPPKALVNAMERKQGHGVKHYRLCERCSHVFTLVYDESQGVVLKALWPELLAEKPAKQLLAG